MKGGTWQVPRKVQILILLSFSIGCMYLQSVLLQIPECTCGECHIIDPWFSAHFNSAYHPLMTRNSTVSAEDFKWWKWLQRTNSGQEEYKEVVNTIFQAIPDKEMYRDAGPERCRVCSVVGNSGNLINSSYGPMIDDGDFVFRINRGPTKGFERDVGSKTTHRVIYPESAVHMDNSTHMVFFAFKMKDLKWLVSLSTSHKRINRGPTKGFERDVGSKTTHRVIYPESAVHMDNSTHMVFFAFKMKDLKWLVSLSTSHKRLANMNLVMVVSPSFMKYVHHQWLMKHGQYPSTGFMTLILALHICDKVRVFGFGADKNGNWNHYFERTPRNYKTGIHGGNFEYDTLKELQKRKKLQVYG